MERYFRDRGAVDEIAVGRAGASAASLRATRGTASRHAPTAERSHCIARGKPFTRKSRPSCTATPGIIANLDSRCIAVNGTENHVHTLVSLGKTMATSNLVREVKKGSTSWLKRQEAVSREFSWQDGCRGFSVGRSELPAVRRYIASQKEHHRRVSNDEELVSLLDEHGVDYDAPYLWD